MSIRTNPATKWVDITNSDTAELSVDVRSIYVKTDGNLVLTDVGGNDVTFPVTTGQIIPVCPKLIKATGSTATCAALYG